MVDFSKVTNVTINGNVNVNAIYNNGVMLWGHTSTMKNYLTFHSDADQTIKMTWTNDHNFYWSKDAGDTKTWTPFTNGTAVAFNGDIFVWGDNPNGVTLSSVTSSGSATKFVFGSNTVPVSCTGNVMTLINGENPPVIMTEGTFLGLFYQCKCLTSAPSLPATTITPYAYAYMFYQCTSLVTAPSMAAVTLKDYCYNNMFYGCTSLTSPSNITISGGIGNQGCNFMFYGCTALATTPNINVTSIGTSGCNFMFYGCTSLTSASNITISGDISSSGCCDMFYGCTSLVTLPNINVTSIDANGCYFMFSGCTSLTSASNITISGGIGSSGCTGMFNECTALVTPPNINVTSIGTSGCSGMFGGCTSLTSASNITISGSIGNQGCRSMFNGCTSLVTPPNINGITSIGDNGCASLFENCGALTSSPVFNYTGVVNEKAFSSAFYKCTSLTDTPNFALNNVMGGGCHHMFYECTSLTSASNITISGGIGNQGCGSMFYGCTSLATPPNINGIASIGDYGCNWMFKGCSSLYDNTGVNMSLLKSIGDSGCEQMFYDTHIGGNVCLNGLERVGEDGCKAMFQSTDVTSVTLGNFVNTSSGGFNSAFYNCHNISYVKGCVSAPNGGKEHFNIMFSATGQVSYLDASEFTIRGDILEGECNGMFSSANLSYMPNFKDVTSVASNGMRDMFVNNKNISYGPDLRDVVVIADNGCAGMCASCKNMEYAYDFPNLIYVGNGGLAESFVSCSLSKAPEMPEIYTINEKAFTRMYYNNLNIHEIRCHATQINGSVDNKTYGTYDWVYNVPTTGTFYKNSYMNDWMVDSVHGIPLGWTVVDETPTYKFVTFKSVGPTHMTINDTQGQMYYSFNKVDWNEVVYGQSIAFNGNIYVNGVNPYNPKFTFDSGVNIYASGNVMTLFDRENPHDSLIDYNHYLMETFEGCDMLVTPPDMGTITGIGSGKCAFMFLGCTSLKYAPNLSNVTKILGGDAGGGCVSMFFRCLSLERVPNLSKLTEIGDGACVSMFNGCSSITLPANLGNVTTVGKYGCQTMYYNCTSLTEMSNLDNIVNIDDSSMNSMYENCTSLKYASKMNSVKTIGESGCASMFKGCTSLVETPQMRNLESVAKWGCKSMFEGCTALEYYDIGTSNGKYVTLGEEAYSRMFYGCSNLLDRTYQGDGIYFYVGKSSGVGCLREMFMFCVKYKGLSQNIYIENGLTSIPDNMFMDIFYHCAALEKNPIFISGSFSIRTIGNSSFDSTFAYCESLTNISLNFPMVTTIGGGAFAHFADGCKSISATSLSLSNLTTMGEGAFYRAFADCYSLKSGLTMNKVTTIPPRGCKEMYAYSFGADKNITSKVTTIEGSIDDGTYGTYDWLKGTSDGGKFTKAASATQWRRDDHGIPPTWTIIEQ